MDALSFALEELELQSVEEGIKIDGSGAWFIFDLGSNTCLYICPSISSITDLNSKNYTDQCKLPRSKKIRNQIQGDISKLLERTVRKS